MGRPKSDRVRFFVRVPQKLVGAYESYVEDNCLDRNLVITLLMAKFLAERGAASSVDVAVTQIASDIARFEKVGGKEILEGFVG